MFLRFTYQVKEKSNWEDDKVHCARLEGLHSKLMKTVAVDNFIEKWSVAGPPVELKKDFPKATDRLVMEINAKLVKGSLFANRLSELHDMLADVVNMHNARKANKPQVAVKQPAKKGRNVGGPCQKMGGFLVVSSPPRGNFQIDMCMHRPQTISHVCFCVG